MKKILIYCVAAFALLSCKDDEPGELNGGGPEILRFTLEGVEYVKNGKQPGELAYYGQTNNGGYIHYLINIAGSVSGGAHVVFLLGSDSESNALQYRSDNITQFHNFTIAFQESDDAETTIYHANNDVAVSFAEKTLPTSVNNGSVKGTFEGVFNAYKDGVRIENGETQISGSFNVVY